MEKTIVKLEATRTHHRAADAAVHSLTVGELIGLLEQYDEDSKVIFSNDGGYTYGYMTYAGTVGEINPQEED